MSRDPFDLIWRVADSPQPTFSRDDVVALRGDKVERLTKLGVLREGKTVRHVSCDACADGHTEAVTTIKYPDGNTRFFINCPGQGRVEVERHRLIRWSVDFEPILSALASALSVRGAPTEVVPTRVWNLGRASLVGKSRTVWVARGLTWPDADQIAGALPKGRSPVLFYLGQAADDGFLDIPREAIIELRTVVRCDDELVIDRDAVESQLAEIADAPAKKRSSKRAQRDATVGKLKRELHQRIISFKSAVRHADDGDSTFTLPHLTQKELAEAIEANESTVSRAINESGDRELAILLQTVADENLIRRYGR